MARPANMNDLVLLLERATQKESVKWIPEEGETDTFSARFDSGVVRISQIIVGSTYLLEMLDLDGHTIVRVQSSPQVVVSSNDQVTYILMERLRRCAGIRRSARRIKWRRSSMRIRRRAGEGGSLEGVTRP